MQSDQVKMRFGRCPYCRAMIYQDPNAIIYYCSKCRTPIRGKNPDPKDDDEYALAQLEILSFDTMSTFSDDTAETSRSADIDPIPSSSSRDSGAPSSSSSAYRPYSAIRTGPRSGDLGRHDETEVRGSPVHGRVSELRPASRRTRRPASADLDAKRDQGSGDEGGEFDVPRTRSASCYGRRASPLSSQELEKAVLDLSGDVRGNGTAAGRSPLGDPAFQQDLLQALENLRKLIVAVEEPLRVDAPRLAAGAPPKSASAYSNGAPQKVTRRDSRILRRLESQLAHALPEEDKVRRRDKAPNSSSSLSSVPALASASASSSRRGASSRHLICRPILGGTPFVACDKCEEMLQLPGALSLDRLARLQCGGCGEILTVTLPATSGGSSADRPRKIFSAPQPAGFGANDAEEEHMRARSRLSAEQLRQGPDQGPLHRVLGYSSVSSVLRSRRYDEHI